ncbi:MAG: hypothetical protein JW727_04800 [Candidatus Aenigmarchaeota archaeon]|nr:hypothetical protein [Candidatus Aenigmarchaeota archaeon]
MVFEYSGDGEPVMCGRPGKKTPERILERQALNLKLLPGDTYERWCDASGLGGLDTASFAKEIAEVSYLKWRGDICDSCGATYNLFNQLKHTGVLPLETGDVMEIRDKQIKYLSENSDCQICPMRDLVLGTARKIQF